MHLAPSENIWREAENVLHDNHQNKEYLLKTVLIMHINHFDDAFEVSVLKFNDLQNLLAVVEFLEFEE